MHIAQFIHRYPPALGGAERYTARLCEYFARCGDSVAVWTTDALALEDMWRLPPREEGSRLTPFEQMPAHTPPSPEVHRYRPLRFPLRRYVLKALSLIPLASWQSLTSPCNPICPAMWRDARRYKGPFDAVHAAAFPYSFPIACALRLARRRGVPFFLTPFLHLGDPSDPHDMTRRQYSRPHLRWLLLQADGVFVQTRLERDFAVSLGVAEERVHLQGLGVDTAECTGGNRGTARQKWNVQPHEVIIGHLANASEEKGTCDLLRAAKLAWSAGHRFRVVLAGPEMPNFCTFWRSYEPKDRVTRLGVLTDPQKRDFFVGIDAFVLPSRTDSFGLVLLEAWANGKPNLVYRAGGPAELIRDGVDGLQAGCGDIAELSTSLLRLIRDAELRTNLGERGRARVGVEFRWKDKLDLVRSVLQGKQSSTAIRNPRGVFTPRAAETIVPSG